MTNPRGTPTVLIVDEDVAFVWWLGEVFREAGFQSVPALDGQKALALCQDLGLGIDLIAANPRLAGVSEMIETLKKTRPRIRVLLLIDPGEELPSGDTGLTMLERPGRGEHVTRTEWVEKLQRVLKRLQATAAG